MGKIPYLCTVLSAQRTDARWRVKRSRARILFGHPTVAAAGADCLYSQRRHPNWERYSPSTKYNSKACAGDWQALGCLILRFMLLLLLADPNTSERRPDLSSLIILLLLKHSRAPSNGRIPYPEFGLVCSAQFVSNSALLWLVVCRSRKIPFLVV